MQGSTKATGTLLFFTCVVINRTRAGRRLDLKCRPIPSLVLLKTGFFGWTLDSGDAEKSVEKNERYPHTR